MRSMNLSFVKPTKVFIFENFPALLGIVPTHALNYSLCSRLLASGRVNRVVILDDWKILFLEFLKGVIITPRSIIYFLVGE